VASRTGPFSAPAGYRDSSARALANGEVIASTYVIRDEIARADTGVVFEARDMLLERAVAFKLAWRDPGTPPLINEARRCAAVRDPCAVQIHGLGNHNGVDYAVGERVTGKLLRDVIGDGVPASRYLPRLRTLVAAVARAHEAGVAVGDISGSTVLACDDDRVVLGRLSLSQVPALGALGQVLAPELARGEVEAGDPAAAEAIDLYGLGCVAIELACGVPPFSYEELDVLRGHASAPPPRLDVLRPDLPTELCDLVAWLLAKHGAARPRSASDVLAQVDALIERAGAAKRTVRVLVVDDDTARARWLWSLTRRAHASAAVEISNEGTDAAHKLHRDQPDLVFVDAKMRGVMNALELCMYARGIESEHTQLVLLGDVAERDRALLADAGVAVIADDAHLADAILDRVREHARAAPRLRAKRKTISG
jgi:serine/threonine protein kinase